MTDERLFKLGNVWFDLCPEGRVFALAFEFSRGQIGKVELSQGDDAAGDDDTGIRR